MTQQTKINTVPTRCTHGTSIWRLGVLLVVGDISTATHADIVQRPDVDTLRERLKAHGCNGRCAKGVMTRSGRPPVGMLRVSLDRLSADVRSSL